MGSISNDTSSLFHKYENNTLPSKFIRKIIFNIDKDRVLFSKIKRISLISPNKKKSYPNLPFFPTVYEKVFHCSKNFSGE
jgi:hypothetical protein